MELGQIYVIRAREQREEDVGTVATEVVANMVGVADGKSANPRGICIRVSPLHMAVSAWFDEQRLQHSPRICVL